MCKPLTNLRSLVQVLTKRVTPRGCWQLTPRPCREDVTLTRDPSNKLPCVTQCHLCPCLVCKNAPKHWLVPEIRYYTSSIVYTKISLWFWRHLIDARLCDLSKNMAERMSARLNECVHAGCLISGSAVWDREVPTLEHARFICASNPHRLSSSLDFSRCWSWPFSNSSHHRSTRLLQVIGACLWIRHH